MRLALLALSFLAAATHAPAAQAQSPLLPPVGRGVTVGVEALRIGWENGDNGAVRGSVLFLTGQAPLGAGLRLVLDVPVAVTQPEGAAFPSSCSGPCPEGESGWQEVLGNPYVGLKAAAAGDPYTGEIGVRLPLGRLDGQDQNQLRVAQLVGFGRAEAFASRRVVVVAMGGLAHAATRHIVLRARAGGTATLGESVGAALVEGEAAWRRRPFRLAATALARVVLSDGKETLAERAGVLVGLEATAALNRLRPGVRIRVPVGTAFFPDALGPTVGVTLSLALDAR